MPARHPSRLLRCHRPTQFRLDLALGAGAPALYPHAGLGESSLAQPSARCAITPIHRPAVWHSGWLLLAWVSFTAVALIWMDATNYWFASLPVACIGIHLQNAEAQLFFLQDGIVIGACLLGSVGLAISTSAFRRYQRARAAAGRIIL